MAKTTKKISIDRLAIMIKSGFDEVDKQFVAVNAKIDSVDSRLSAKIDGVDRRLSAKIDGVDARVQNLQKQMDNVCQDIGIIKSQLSLVERLERLERKVFGQVAA